MPVRFSAINFETAFANIHKHIIFRIAKRKEWVVEVWDCCKWRKTHTECAGWWRSKSLCVCDCLVAIWSFRLQFVEGKTDSFFVCVFIWWASNWIESKERERENVTSGNENQCKHQNVDCNYKTDNVIRVRRSGKNGDEPKTIIDNTEEQKTRERERAIGNITIWLNVRFISHNFDRVGHWKTPICIYESLTLDIKWSWLY